MKKYNLIINHIKLNLKKKSHLIFFDEFLYNLLIKKKIRNNHYFYVNNFFYLEKKKINYVLLKKKLERYRKELTYKLNTIHNTSYSVNFWGLVLDYFLSVLICAIETNLDRVIRIKKRYDFNVKLVDLKNIFILDTSDFLSCLEEDHHYSAYIRSVIINKIFKKKNYKTLIIKKKFSNEIKISYNIFYKSIYNIIVFFIRIYIFIVRPTLILDGYFKIKNSLLIFIKSYGRVVFFKNKYVFYKRNITIKKNQYLRKNIKIKENDFFDRIFNILLTDFFPSSYLELFKVYNDKSFFLNRINKIGSGVNVVSDDRYKYLAGKILNKKGLLFTFQHGSFFEKANLKLSTLVEKKYSSKIFYWNDKKGLGLHYLSNLEKNKIDNIKKNKSILLYQTTLIQNDNYAEGVALSIKNHPHLNYLYEFYDRLDVIYKSISLIKLFPQHNINFIKKIWLNKFGNNINFADENRNLNLFYKSRIVILDDISTSLIELLYIDVPFILIHSNKFYEYDTKNRKYFNYLIKLNILFLTSKEASNFINNNYDNIYFWWKKVSKDKIFNKFKNQFFFAKKNNYIKKIVPNLL